jgi:hypothetical protein
MCTVVSVNKLGASWRIWAVDVVPDAIVHSDALFVGTRIIVRVSITVITGCRVLLSFAGWNSLAHAFNALVIRSNIAVVTISAVLCIGTIGATTVFMVAL